MRRMGIQGRDLDDARGIHPHPILLRRITFSRQREKGAPDGPG